MTCTDCSEPIVESERRSACLCERCHQPMHGECAMIAPGERELCERCFNADATGFMFAMMKGAEA